MKTLKKAADKVRPPKVIKKVYQPGSPGAARKGRGVTLTQVKSGMTVSKLNCIVILDEQGQPTGEQTVVAVRDPTACARARRSYTERGLLGRTKTMRRKELRAIAIERKVRRGGKRPVKAAPVVAQKKGRK